MKRSPDSPFIEMVFKGRVFAKLVTNHSELRAALKQAENFYSKELDV